MHNEGTNRRACRWLRSSVVVLCSSCVPAWQARAATPLPTLTHADEVRHLTPEKADLSYPVRIRGIITNDVPAPDFFIQDATGGVYVLGSHSKPFPHHLGDRIEIEGTTQAGGFAPVVREGSSTDLGRGALPRSPLYSFGELFGGQMDSQWAKIRGVVRSASIDRHSWHEPALVMTLAASGGEFEVRVPIFSSQIDITSWIGREVSIEGVCGSLFKVSHQLVGIIFYVPRLSLIKTLAEVSAIRVGALLRFSPDRTSRDRVRLKGVVTYQQPGKAIFLQSAGKGLRVLTQQANPLQPGDVIEVLGFPAMGESEPVLEDAVFQQVGHQAPLAPVNLEVSPPFERYDGSLVTANATLLGRRQQPDGLHMLLEQNGSTFDATLSPGNSSERLLSIPLKSELRIVGICLVRNGGVWHNPQSFRLLVRTSADILVTHSPSWWNLRRSIWLLVIMAGALLVVFTWMVMLQGRLREQIVLYRQKLHGSAILEERNRIARELHDTLEQDLAGITMQLDLAADCFEHATPVSRRAVEIARNMSRHGMLEARRSVRDLRCHLLENGDLVYALGQVVELLALRDHTRINVKVAGKPTRLASPLELNLLRIAQEAMTNAIKHARAMNITVELTYDPKKVRLSVTDDGKGFARGEPTLGEHFGLVDMRERAQMLGSHLQIDSEAGVGTRVELDVALKT